MAQNQDTHLISDHDNIGEAQTWCGEEAFLYTDELAVATCIKCLKATMIYGAGAAERLLHLAADDGKTDLGYPRCEHIGCPSRHYRVIQRHEREVKAGRPRNYCDDPQRKFEQGASTTERCCREIPLTQPACANYELPPLNSGRTDCLACGHLFGCHAEAEPYQEGTE